MYVVLQTLRLEVVSAWDLNLVCLSMACIGIIYCLLYSNEIKDRDLLQVYASDLLVAFFAAFLSAFSLFRASLSLSVIIATAS